MKKAVLTLALVMAVGFAGLSVAEARWGGGYGGGGWCNGAGGWGNGPGISYEAMNTFHNDTAELRKQIYEKRTEYYDLVNKETPDKEAAQKVWSEIFDLQNQMNEKAVAAGMMQGAGGRMMW